MYKPSLIDCDLSRSPNSHLKVKSHSKVQLFKFRQRIHKLAHKECLAHALETSKTADMEKGDIPITQIDDEVEVLGEDRLQSNF
jgi:hypothetical protein